MVLPFVPVTPINSSTPLSTCAIDRRYLRNRDERWLNGMKEGQAQVLKELRAWATPFATASAINSWPSECSPFHAANTVPADTLRESLVIDVVDCVA